MRLLFHLQTIFHRILLFSQRALQYIYIHKSKAKRGQTNAQIRRNNKVLQRARRRSESIVSCSRNSWNRDSSSKWWGFWVFAIEIAGRIPLDLIAPERVQDSSVAHLTADLSRTFCLSIINPGWPDYRAASESIRGCRKNSADSPCSPLDLSVRGKLVFTLRRLRSLRCHWMGLVPGFLHPFPVTWLDFAIRWYFNAGNWFDLQPQRVTRNRRI